jgi:intracellular sulfur oxidation DsrE/DsrF family protein
MRKLRRTVLLLLAAGIAQAQQGPAGAYLEVSPHDAADIAALFSTLEAGLEDQIEIDHPVVVVLHGEEAFSFTRAAYARNKALMDRAAVLDAFELIEVKMCETWMRDNGIEAGDVPPFIEVVPYAPEEIERLEADGYLPYDKVEL